MTMQAASEDTDWHSVSGKYVLGTGLYEWSIVGGVRYVTRASDSGTRLYVRQLERDGSIDEHEPETWMVARKVKLICDTWEEVQSALALNREAMETHIAMQKQFAEAKKAIKWKLLAMCASRLRDTKGGEP
ncbi:MULTISPECIES: hypothetical protein [unclassified Azospirillum]|uniref:hypothetical protein n=1 Tax=unclassified Azospirillum TaxID=2630922 RepID=UPI000D64F631|nr:MULTISPECIES: hypothetical protein [unclassified Azospirillum]